MRQIIFPIVNLCISSFIAPTVQQDDRRLAPIASLYQNDGFSLLLAAKAENRDPLLRFDHRSRHAIRRSRSGAADSMPRTAPIMQLRAGHIATKRAQVCFPL